MEPLSWYDDLENTLRTAVTEDSSMQAAFLVLTGYALHIATVEWQKMALYFDTLLGPKSVNDEDSALLSPDKHDRLLFEDEGFSRSRKYFWVIDALTRFIEEIEEAQDAWERYCSHEVEPFLQMPTWENREMITHNFETAKEEVARLETVRRRLEKHLEKTKVLRDGVSRFVSTRSFNFHTYEHRLSFIAIQCQRRHRIPRLYRTWPERALAHLCQHLLPSTHLLYSKCLPMLRFLILAHTGSFDRFQCTS